MAEDIGKKAEKKIRELLNRPEKGYDFNRIPDNMTGFYGARNICDFDLYKHPYKYYIESKATYHSRFDFSMISDYQYEQMMLKSGIPGVHCLIFVLFATYQRAFTFRIEDIDNYIKTSGKKSLNIEKINTWNIPYCEVKTVPNNRKQLLDYTGEIEEYVPGGIKNEI